MKGYDRNVAVRTTRNIVIDLRASIEHNNVLREVTRGADKADMLKFHL